MRQVLWFIAGFIMAVLLARWSATVNAQQAIVMAGSLNNVVTVVQVSSAGAITVAQ